VFVALVIHHALRMRHIVIWDLSGCTIFFHVISNGTIFYILKKIERKICVLMFSTALKRFSLQEELSEL
jgi:hypothetical protein